MKESKEIIKKASELGYCNLFPLPEKKDIQSYIDLYMNAIPNKDGSRAGALTMLWGVINRYSVELAKTHLALEANGIKFIESEG